MTRTFRQVTVTINEEILTKFKEFCKEKKLPLSRFLSYAGIEFMGKGENNGIKTN